MDNLIPSIVTAVSTLGSFVLSVFIYRANNTSRKSQAMPYLQVDITDCEYCRPYESEESYVELKVSDYDKTDMVSDLKKRIRFTNIGLGTLHRSKIIWETSDKRIRKEFGRNMVIPPHNSCEIDAYFTTKKYIDDCPLILDTPEGRLTFEYSDLLGNQYRQSVNIYSYLSEDGLDHIEFSSATPPEELEKR